MNKITFLGPIGATFSHVAYDILADIYDTPAVAASALETNCVPVTANGKILETIISHGGYGTIAMETLAEGRVGEPVESFIDLLRKYDGENCPIRVIGAVGMELHFCLMAKPGVSLDTAKGIIAHPKSLGACRQKVLATKLSTTEVSSNGEAARLVAESADHSLHLALGPISAAEKYGLQILDSAFEDERAVTTFFLLAPNSCTVSVGEKNRVLVVCEVPHRPRGLVDTLLPFSDRGINFIHTHSVHVRNGTYHFALEAVISENQRGALEEALADFKKVCPRYLVFGPFEVVER